MHCSGYLNLNVFVLQCVSDIFIQVSSKCLRLPRPIICTHKSTRTEVAVDSLIILFRVLSSDGVEVWCLGLGLGLGG